MEKLAIISGFEILYYRTEWLDIYSMDIKEFYNIPNQFIHKRNTYLENYSKSIMLEDKVQEELNIDLKDGGNYMIAILRKI